MTSPVDKSGIGIYTQIKDPEWISYAARGTIFTQFTGHYCFVIFVFL